MKKWILLLAALTIIIIAFFIMRPKISDNYYNKAVVYADSSNYEQAIEYFTKAIKFNKKNKVALLKRANIYYQTDKEKEALEDFNNLLILDTNNYEAYFGRALLFIKQNEW